MNVNVQPIQLPLSQPMRPSAARYEALLASIWERTWLTNNGPLVRQLEADLSAFLGLPHFIATANGTLSLHLILRALGLDQGEILTTPFSFVSTVSSAAWEGLTPVFADIDPDTWNIDPADVQRRITPRTSAILATHVFGNPCAIEPLDAIASAAGIPVIYDAAHAFGVTYRGRSLLRYGAAAAISFHATKLFHTAEGGGVFFHDPGLDQRVRELRAIGFDSQGRINRIGINAKLSELHAAVGLALLSEMEAALEYRRKLWEHYQNRLGSIRGMRFQKIAEGTVHNAAYAACLFSSEEQVLHVRQHLMANGVSTRRYFHPTLDSLAVFPTAAIAPVASRISKRILCLPLFHDLSIEQVDSICDLVESALSSQPLSAR